MRESKMRKKIKILFVVLNIMIIMISASANTGVMKKDVWYNDINITLNGKKITPRDANGTYVEPFIIDGVTYLPVRGIASALSLDVEWDENSNTVKLSTPNQTSQKEVIYDLKGIKISYMGCVHERGDFEVKLLIENNSNEEVTVQARDTSLNDFVVTGLISETVGIGKKANSKIKFNSFRLAENGIQSVEEVEFSLLIFNSDDWKTIGRTGLLTIKNGKLIN